MTADTHTHLPIDRHTQTHNHPHIPKPINAQTYKQTHLLTKLSPTLTYPHTDTPAHICPHTHTYTQIHIYRHPTTHPQAQTNQPLYTHTHTPLYTYTGSHIQSLLGNLAGKTAPELQTYFDDLFLNHAGRVELDRVDILEAAELVRRSRQISVAFREAQEFETNFIKVRSKIPRTFFHRRAINISTMTKAMIFVVHYVRDKITAAKHVKQSLKKNTSFRAFALDMNEVLTELTTLGVLTTEQRVKRSRVRNEPGAGDNAPNFRDTRETFFKLLYDDNNDRHIFWTVFRLFFLDRPFVNHRFDCGEEVNYI